MNTGDCAAYCEKFDLGASVVASSVGSNGGGGYSCGCVDSDTDETTFACDAEHEKQVRAESRRSARRSFEDAYNTSNLTWLNLTGDCLHNRTWNG